MVKIDSYLINEIDEDEYKYEIVLECSHPDHETILIYLNQYLDIFLIENEHQQEIDINIDEKMINDYIKNHVVVSDWIEVNK